jgi:predicted polyphosphate/ATP-dependent NAD kinase
MLPYLLAPKAPVIFIPIGMNITRRTISIPRRLAKEVEQLARKERRSFSAAVSHLVEEALRRRKDPYTFFGAGESGTPDLGERSEEILREVISEWRD